MVPIVQNIALGSHNTLAVGGGAGSVHSVEMPSLLLLTSRQVTRKILSRMQRMAFQKNWPVSREGGGDSAQVGDR